MKQETRNELKDLRPPHIYTCGVKDYGCGRPFSIKEKVIQIFGPGFDIPDSLWHEGCREDAERYCDDRNRRLEQ